MKRLNKTESAVFLFCRFSPFLNDSFFQIILRPTVINIESFLPVINVVLRFPIRIEQIIALRWRIFWALEFTRYLYLGKS